MFFKEFDPLHIWDSFEPGVLNVVFFGEDCKADIPALIAQANKRGLLIAGGVMPAVIYEDQSSTTGLILLHAAEDFIVKVYEKLNDQEMDIDLTPIPEEFSSTTILIDGYCTGIPRFLERMYERYYNTLTYLGAGCGRLNGGPGQCVFTNDGFFENSALCIFSGRKIRTGVKHGWKKIAGPFLANKARNGVINELDWEPAFDVYQREVARYSGKEVRSTDFFSVARGYPLGIYREGQENVVRDLIRLNDDRSLGCLGEVNKNTSMYILTADHESLVMAAHEAASDVAKNISPISLFVVDCITRAMYLDKEYHRELNAVSGVFQAKNPDIQLHGVLSLGEISSHGDGYIEFFTKTIVVSSAYI